MSFKSYKQLNSNKRFYDVYPNFSEEVHPVHNTIWTTFKWRESSLPLQYHRTEMKKTRYKLVKDYFSVDGALYKDDKITIHTIDQISNSYRVESKDGKLYTVPQDKIILDKK